MSFGRLLTIPVNVAGDEQRIVVWIRYPYDIVYGRFLIAVIPPPADRRKMDVHVPSDFRGPP
jgi:hypothetical protein